MKIRKYFMKPLISLFIATIILIPSFASADWEQDGDDWLYFDENTSEYVKGWFELNDNRYYFNEEGKLVTGLQLMPRRDSELQEDLYYYYFSETSDPKGIMQTGWHEIDNYWYYFLPETEIGFSGVAATGFLTDPADGNIYYFRTEQDEISPGPIGTRVVGFAEIDDSIYYFRQSEDDISEGPEGSAIKDECVAMGNSRYCFDENGILTSTKTYTTPPTDHLCLNQYYSGEEQVITVADYEYDPENPDYIERGYVFSNNVQTNVGDYQVVATLKNGYIWDDNTTANKEITCSIIKLSVDKPELNEDEYEYTGNEITPEINGYDIEWFESSGDISATNAGDYQITVGLKDKINTEWSDNTTEDLTFDWSITKTNRPAPVVVSDSVTYDGEEHTVNVISSSGTLEYSLDGIAWTNEKPTIIDVGTQVIFARVAADANHEASPASDGTITITKLGLEKPTIEPTFGYTGNEITPTINNLNSNRMNVVGTTSATAVGDYSITVSLKDTANTEWSDHSTTGVLLNWSITKGKKAKPLLEAYFGTYDGNPHTIEATGDGTLEYSLDALEWSTTKPTATTAGVTIVHVRVKGDSNYDDSDVEQGIIMIYKVNVAIPTLDNSEFVYTGDEILPSITDLNLATTNLTGTTSATNAGDYEITLSLKDPINYQWANESINDITYDWTIAKKDIDAPTVVGFNGIYDGEPHTITVTGTGTIMYSLNNDSWVDELPTITDAGSQIIYVKALGDDNHNDSETVSETVKIEKASITPPVVTNYSGDYDGSAHSITVTPVPIGTIKYSIDNVNWDTTKPTRTEAGTTTVYVKVFGTNNYSDSEKVTGTITIIAPFTYEIKNYPVDETNKYINKIITGTELSTFTQNITLGTGYSVVVDTKTVNGKKLLYTGGKTKIMNGSTVVKEYTNIVIGDTNGDGLTNSGDLVRIRLHLLGLNPLKGIYFTAADIDYNDVINSGDLVRVRLHLLKLRLIGE